MLTEQQHERLVEVEEEFSRTLARAAREGLLQFRPEVHAVVRAHLQGLAGIFPLAGGNRAAHYVDARTAEKLLTEAERAQLSRVGAAFVQMRTKAVANAVAFFPPETHDDVLECLHDCTSLYSPLVAQLIEGGLPEPSADPAAELRAAELLVPPGRRSPGDLER